MIDDHLGPGPGPSAGAAVGHGEGGVRHARGRPPLREVVVHHTVPGLGKILFA